MAAIIRIEIQSSGGVQEVQRDLQGLGDSAEDSGKKFSALGEIGLGALRQIGTLGVDLALKGLSAVAGAISDGIADAKANAILQAQTAAVIKSTGQAAGVSAQQVAEYASSLSDAAGASLFGDDQVQESTNLLLTFTNIKQKSLEAATAISVDMAQALGGAPKDAAIQLGKALNDPIAGISALSRVGVSFTEQQEKQIQAMQKSGDIAGAQAVILAELNKEFGGSAKAAADATGGWSEFNGRMGEAKETLGAAVLPLLNMLAGVLVQTVMPVVEGLAASFGDLIQAIQTSDEWSSSWLETLGYVIDRVLGLSDAVGPVQNALATVADLFRDTVIPTFQQIVAFISDNMGPVLAGLGASLTAIGVVVIPPLIVAFGAWAAGAIAAAAATVLALAPVVLPIIAIGAAVALLKAAWDSDFGGIKTTLTAFWENTGKPIFEQLKTWLSDTLAAAIRSLSTLWTGTLQPALNAVWSFLNAYIIPLFTALANVAIALVKKEVELLAALWNNVLKPALNAVWSFIQTNVVPILQTLANTALADVKAKAQEVSDFWNGTLKPAFEAIASVITATLRPALSGLDTVTSNVAGWLDNIGDAVSGVIDWLKKLADSINAIEIPSWLKGDSPPPMADWLNYIGESASKVAGTAFPALGESIANVFSNGTGASVIGNLIQGIQEMIPSLLGVVGGISDDLVSQVEGIADKLSGAMSDALLSTASLDRAKAKAIGALKDISEAQQDEIQKQLAATSDLAAQFGDPKQAAAFFKQRSDQIFELARLRDQIEKATDEKAKARFIEQFNLIGKAQQNELQALAATGDTGPFGALAAQVQKLLAAPGLPGQLDPGGGILGQLFAALPQLVAMTGGNTAPSNVSSLANDNRQFSYTVNTTAAVTPIDYQTARALAGV